MIELNESARDFFLYTYFGIKNCDDISYEDICKKCSERAYLDLARTIRFSKSTKDIDEMKKEEAKNYIKKKNELIKNIKSSIFESIKVIDENKFNCWHKDTCEKIINSFKNSELLNENFTFTYGQAQKWLNMTLKYVWLLGKLPKNIKNVLHVPVDSYIIEAAYDLGVSLDIQKEKWSKWDNYDSYIEFQDAIKKDCNEDCPIIWEGKAWIEVAKRHTYEN